MDEAGDWVTILEYAQVKKTSVSTIRRRIKANLIKHKEEKGRYLIWFNNKGNIEGNDRQLIAKELDRIKAKNARLEEEIRDLKMLLSVYEEKAVPPIPSDDTLELRV